MNQVAKTAPFTHPASNGHKVCTQCKENLPLSRFSERVNHGRMRILSKCNQCLSRNRLSLKFKQKYGITLDDYEQMYEAQHGLCYLCDEGGPQRLPNGRPRLLLDHHHQSGKVRKLLCNTCNWKIGILETTSAEWMTRARNYIDDV